MAQFILKPIFWNTNNYKFPSGARATSGFPEERGYGHEEWNNSPRLQFEQSGKQFCAFHTEGIGKALSHESEDDIFIFMYASHDGIQELVGIAGLATCLLANDSQTVKLRKGLSQKLNLVTLSDDAWRVERVREKYDDNERQFLSDWRADVDWIPNWYCPSNFFLWLEKPVKLDSLQLTGKKRLTPRFTVYQRATRRMADDIMMSIPELYRNNAWENLRATIIESTINDIEADLSDVENQENLSETVREQLIDARVGQGAFRKALMQKWANACAVSGCTVTVVLKASHIKPWRNSTNKQRLDADNGLLLRADLDALFDQGLISFDDMGNMLVATSISVADKKLLNLPQQMRRAPTVEEMKYLKLHREKSHL